MLYDFSKILPQVFHEWPALSHFSSIFKIIISALQLDSFFSRLNPWFARCHSVKFPLEPGSAEFMAVAFRVEHTWLRASVWYTSLCCAGMNRGSNTKPSQPQQLQLRYQGKVTWQPFANWGKAFAKENKKHVCLKDCVSMSFSHSFYNSHLLQIYFVYSGFAVWQILFNYW